MELNSVGFLAFAAGVIVVSHCIPSTAGRRLVLMVASALFIASYVNNALQLVPLLLFLLLGFAVVKMLQARPSRVTAAGGIAAIILFFVYLKRFSFIEPLPELPFAYVAVGLSYILFRIIHVAIDVSQGDLRNHRIGPVDFFNYTCNFLSFVSGPIQRFQEFSAGQEKRLELDEQAAFSAFARIVKGFIKVAVVSAIANHVFGRLSVRLLETGGDLGMAMMASLWAVSAISYTAYLYYNFAGYMDIVIGIGRLMGIELPENFNRPFAARNFLDFWSRWHMTLSNWFKVYVFNPLLMALTVRFHPFVAQSVLGVAAFFVTFLIMGMWHGTTSVFLVYGLAMGAGASANKLWQIGMTRYFGKKGYRTISGKPLYAGFATGLTAAWFVLALTCFWVDARQLAALMELLGVAGTMLTFCILTAAAGLVLPLTDYFAHRWAAALPRLVTHGRGTVARNLTLGAQVVLIAGVTSFFHKAPEFVYRTF